MPGMMEPKVEMAPKVMIVPAGPKVEDGAWTDGAQGIYRWYFSSILRCSDKGGAPHTCANNM